MYRKKSLWIWYVVKEATEKVRPLHTGILTQGCTLDYNHIASYPKQPLL